MSAPTISPPAFQTRRHRALIVAVSATLVGVAETTGTQRAPDTMASVTDTPSVQDTTGTPAPTGIRPNTPAVVTTDIRRWEDNGGSGRNDDMENGPAYALTGAAAAAQPSVTGGGTPLENEWTQCRLMDEHHWSSKEHGGRAESRISLRNNRRGRPLGQ